MIRFFPALRRYFPYLMAAAILIGVPVASRAADRNAKKVIEYGWDWAYLDEIANSTHLREMEKMPFDGICFRIRGHVRAFDIDPWQEKDFPEDQLRSIQWDRFTDNFISLWGSVPKTSKFNWFDDRQWDVIQKNLQQFSRAVALSRSVGVFFDAEPYGRDVWRYTEKKFPGKSYEQVAAMARTRGEQFMRALQLHKPDIKILQFIMWEQLSPLIHLPPRQRQAKLAKDQYGLLVPFLIGQLSGAGPKVQFIDGNEWSYYDLTPAEFQTGYKRCVDSYKALVPETLRNQIAGQMTYGMSVYMDQVLALRVPTTWMSPVSQYLSPDERTKLFGYVLYNAMASTDQYVWVYSERMKWWPDGPNWKHMMTARKLGKEIKDWSKPYIPDGVEEALRTVIQRYKAGRPLEYDGEKLVNEARKNEKQAKP